MQQGKLERIEFEVIGTKNPLNINISSLGVINGVELEQFYYAPTATPNYSLIGINVNGLKGRFNQYGNGITTLRTLPLKSGVWDYVDNDSEVIRLGTNECNLNLCFVKRKGDDQNSLNSDLVVFDNNYLLNFSLIVTKY